jgi:hypothetical protein
MDPKIQAKQVMRLRRPSVLAGVMEQHLSRARSAQLRTSAAAVAIKRMEARAIARTFAPEAI